MKYNELKKTEKEIKKEPHVSERKIESAPR